MMVKNMSEKIDELNEKVDKLTEKVDELIGVLDFLIEIDTGITGQNYKWVRESVDKLKEC
jgi:pentose-5-phosphate-3-epimerase